MPEGSIKEALATAITEHNEKKDEARVEAMANGKDEEPVEEVKEEAVEETTEETTTEETEDEQEEVASNEPEEEKAEEVKETKDTDLPNNWSEEERSVFEDLPDVIETKDGEEISLKEIKGVVKKRFDDAIRGFNEKARLAADLKKNYGEFDEIFDPHKAMLESSGSNPARWVREVMQTVQNLQTNPAAVIKDLVKTYNVQPSDLGLAQEEQSDYLEEDEQIAELKNTVKQLQQELISFKTSTASDNTQAQLNAFKEAKDSQGNLIHPHFEEAKTDMGILLQSGKAKNLQEAYDMSPTVKSKGIVTQKDDLKKAREEANKAKKAAKTVKSRPASSVTTKKLTIKEALTEKLAATHQ